MTHLGFTLAEVLITLGIIGVVAALTLPALIQNYQKKVTAISVKKAYSELNQIIEMAKADYGDSSSWDYSEADKLSLWVQTYIEPYINVIEHTDSCKGYPCLGLTTTYHLKSKTPLSTGQYVLTKTGNSFAYAFYRYDTSLTRVRVYIRNPHGRYAYVGKDVFTFIFDTRENNPKFRTHTPNKYDRSSILGTGWGGCNPNASGSGYMVPGDACAALIMIDGWEIKNDYPW